MGETPKTALVRLITGAPTAMYVLDEPFNLLSSTTIVQRLKERYKLKFCEFRAFTVQFDS